MTFKKLLWVVMLVGLALLLDACALMSTPEAVVIKETVVIEKEVTRVVEVEKEVFITTTPEPPTPMPELQVFFQDDFEDEDLDWNLRETEHTARFYEDGQYHILIKTSNRLSWSGHPELEVIDDFILEVDVTQVSGLDDNEFGVMFRYQDADNWYAFLISGDGYFKLREQVKDENSSITRWTQVTAIKQGQSTNHLRLVAIGPQISAFVNGELLAIIPDHTFRRGDINLVVGTFDEPDVHIAFDNLKVTTSD